ncbi:hypothetical protein SLL00_03380 [Metabacillus indicus]|uniref:VOC family protein n=1 Tax=Metabacillus indicus TaxID=246786 RepID=UPI002A03F3DF|nr:hypothetical protein [Metabacillus indicus]MDX8288815.1 hypothetical protein [Metabacillus indicus]
MNVLGYRYVTVSEHSMEMADFFQNKLGIPNGREETADNQGGVFTAGDSQLEFWKKSDCMPESVMLQIIVDDADEFAEFASARGIKLDGPMFEEGEKIYALTAPDGMPLTIHSADE